MFQRRRLFLSRMDRAAIRCTARPAFRQIADIYAVLQAVRCELAMRQPHEGLSRPRLGNINRDQCSWWRNFGAEETNISPSGAPSNQTPPVRSDTCKVSGLG